MKAEVRVHGSLFENGKLFWGGPLLTGEAFFSNSHRYPTVRMWNFKENSRLSVYTTNTSVDQITARLFLINRSKLLQPKDLEPVLNECEQLRAILAKSILTAKERK